jgi:hypothetical protein
MKHLNKFYNYLNESTSLDKEEIEDNLLGLKDLVEIDVEELLSSEFRGASKHLFKIKIEYFRIEKERVSIYNRTVVNEYVFNELFWDILNEISVIKNRLGDKYDIGISFSSLVIMLVILEK